MKKIRNVENPFEFETVVFSFSEERILRELIAESSYVAKSLVGQSDLKSGWSRSIIFSEDDKPFLSRWLADARDEMMRALSAYLSDESVSTETTLVFAVLLSRQRRWRSMNNLSSARTGYRTSCFESMVCYETTRRERSPSVAIQGGDVGREERYPVGL